MPQRQRHLNLDVQAMSVTTRERSRQICNQGALSDLSGAAHLAFNTFGSVRELGGAYWMRGMGRSVPLAIRLYFLLLHLGAVRNAAHIRSCAWECRATSPPDKARI
jgi:hypothetical protein